LVAAFALVWGSDVRSRDILQTALSIAHCGHTNQFEALVAAAALERAA
jgi:hypothetical protein